MASAILEPREGRARLFPLGEGAPQSGGSLDQDWPAHLTWAVRVLVAMSGGVDSSVAAARLVRAGYEVVGITLHLWDYPDDGSVRGRCCAPEDVHDARRVADVLGIPHYAFDRRDLFQAKVVDPFVGAYLEGQTPSPCVVCNRGVKIRELLHLRDRLGAELVATGHYARVVEEQGRVRLYRGRDHTKDQSYFLHMLPETTLRHLVFPLGEATKAEVRQEAASLALPGAHKGESQELCFVAAERYADFVAERAPERVRPGAIVDARGRVLGHHAGIHAFTVGQRRNLGVSLGQRAYVVRVDAATATVELGSREELLVQAAVLDEVALAPDLTPPFPCEVAVRYRGRPAPATASSRPDGALVVSFVEPVPAVVKGQFAVLYRGERVLGGGRIREPVGAP